MFKSFFGFTQSQTQKNITTHQVKPQTKPTSIKKTMSLTPLQQQMVQKVEADYQQAEIHFKRAFTRPEILFTLRGKSAGTAHLQLNVLRFNNVLMTENSQIFLDEVVPHEISHLLCFQLFGRVRPHGIEWQRIMRRVFNLKPKTTHQLNTQSVQGAQFEYFCGCGSINLSIRRHNKVVRNETQYRCRKCHEILTR